MSGHTDCERDPVQGPIVHDQPVSHAFQLKDLAVVATTPGGKRVPTRRYHSSPCPEISVVIGRHASRLGPARLR